MGYSRPNPFTDTFEASRDSLPTNDVAHPPETPKTVLIVDDNEDNLTIYSAYLTQRGYHVTVARNGREGVDSALANLPKIILMDLSMPVLDGFAALMLLRADATTETIPVIALTAHALREERDRGMEFGFDGYLSKPIHPLEVINEVARFIGTPGQ